MSRDECTILAKRLRNLRVTAGLTQEKLAKHLNISRSCLANYESCNRVPDDEILSYIAKHFDVSVAYLTGDTNVHFSSGYMDEEVLSKLIPNGQLDVSNISPAARIALLEFYCYLTQQGLLSMQSAIKEQKVK
ncbi:MAG: helix-turn-helix transcriptional regulator [Clostridia bacterium]|nr:helix-turn-helix transcriptional regulator [Clostridia bacterium]